MKTLKDERITELQPACPQHTKPLHHYMQTNTKFIDDKNLTPREQKGCC